MQKLSVALCFLTVLALLVGCSSTAHTGAADIRLDREASYFDDFTVQDETVLLRCVLQIEKRRRRARGDDQGLLPGRRRQADRFLSARRLSGGCRSRGADLPFCGTGRTRSMSCFAGLRRYAAKRRTACCPRLRSSLHKRTAAIWKAQIAAVFPACAPRRDWCRQPESNRHGIATGRF